jgi:hypothetical protein
MARCLGSRLVTQKSFTAIAEHNAPKYAVSEPEFVGELKRQDLEVIPKTKEEIQAEIDHYDSFMTRYNESAEFKARIDAECEAWEKGRQEFEAAEQKRREEAWARGDYTHMIPLDAWYAVGNPYPIPYDPRNAFKGFKVEGIEIIGITSGDE